ncbi:FAD-dependent oxidoreductase [Edaphobacter sp. 12200R-103]|jgi:2-polyprenyl-6-methoxyphenol hydroxylase-like FAD-dependent oxidoreductase|uniref:FAD-dependent oxidoreductase n=1 Tax=Edaphobacter sp. 12200R-103 TaxID=2703788 RepID=UPI00138B6A07|nr:FAD-dependent oxidoreductase [Edaphobacter sp. 12200R-103]QHS51167.1 FAD-dependent oxidoreductase [Edaphobacter sp. 12200R-103]
MPESTRTLASTTCCIIGGGPAGIMLGFLLAREGIPVTVLEKHQDFFRDFRGDTIHPSTLELLYQLGLFDKFLEIRHSKISHLSGVVGGYRATMADFSHLPTRAKYIALMPQWDFLDFLAAEAARFPNFTLRMGWEATGLLQSNGVTTGVIARTPEGVVEIPATLTVGCDGRRAISRQAAHLPLIEQGVPIDVLWLRLPRHDGDPENALGYVNYGRLIGLLNRIDYFQVACLIAKGSFPQLQQAGLSAFQQSLVRIVPFLADRVSEIDSWDKVKLLTVQVNRLTQWSSPGLLCIGDAAHAMSPVGGIGINIALQDAVAAANILAEPLRSNSLTTHHLKWVQQYREKAVRRTQAVQVFAHRILNRVLQNPGPVRPPLMLRIITNIPGFKYLTGRLIGMGLQPEHIRQHEQS